MSFVTTIKQQFEANENVGYGKKQSDYLKRHDILIPIDHNGTNLPLIFNVSCSEAERNKIGPHLRSSLAKSYCFHLYQPFP